MREARRIVWALVAVLACCLAPATASAAALHAELVTIGPGGDDFELYGHSALCLTPEGAADGRCYDFGVAAGDGDEAKLVWESVRGVPRFVPIAVERTRLVGTFEQLGRSVWVQDLPLLDGEAVALQADLEAVVAAGAPYAYHPYFDNCTTRLRDAIDRATSGKLRAGADVVAGGPTFRSLSEHGFSGRVFELAGIAILVGPRAADRQPTKWEAMFLPAALRDAVAERLGAPPTQLFERKDTVLPSSENAGRIALLVLGALLAGTIVYGARKGAHELKVTMAIAGVALGVLGLMVDGVWIASRLAALAPNWVALVLVPTDIALAFVAPRLLPRYLAVRLAMLAGLAALSASTAIAQPLVAVSLFAALPLAAAYYFQRPRAASTARR